MEIVLTHIGPAPLPSYIDVTIRQIRRFNRDVLITFITNECNFKTISNIDLGINLVDEELVRSWKVPVLLKLIKRKEDDFWGATMSRILYIEEYMRALGKRNVIHFENDVLLYSDINDHRDALSNFYNLAITKGGYNQIMTGFFYIRTYRSLEHMTDFWIDVLANNSTKRLKRVYGIGMMNEMTLLYIYSRSFAEEHMDYFPILPKGEHSYNIELFNSLFDPASYGQYVGGTDSKKVPGFLDDRHYIGREMIKNPSMYDVIWKDEGGKVPYLKYAGGTMKINNLHIHSKRLSEFV